MLRRCRFVLASPIHHQFPSVAQHLQTETPQVKVTPKRRPKAPVVDLATEDQQQVDLLDSTMESDSSRASDTPPTRLSEILSERMRELNAEKQRDFKLTTHISTRLPKKATKSTDLVVKASAAAAAASSTKASEEEKMASQFFDDFWDDEFSTGASSSFAMSQQQQQTPSSQQVIVARAIARAGFCSRRAAIDLVASGRVKIDGVVSRNPFQPVAASNDIIVDGHRGRLRFAAPRLWLFHKPAFVSVSLGSAHTDQHSTWLKYAQMLGFDHLVPVGSMPMRQHGLLMLTNDGELARWLEHPSTRMQSTYMFRLRPAISVELAMQLNERGVQIGDTVRSEFEFHPTAGRAGSRFMCRIKVQAPVPRAGERALSPLPIHQVLQALSRRVQRGGRIGFGPFTLRGLPPGGIKEVSVPPYFLKYINPAWAPFVERDWAYFRRLRVQRLRRLARWRHLSDRERDEIETFSGDELREAFARDSSAIEQEAVRFSESIVTEPTVEVPFDPSKMEAEEVRWKF